MPDPSFGSEGFPFSEEDWFRISEAARAVVNAALAEDDSLHASHLEELRCVLADMADKYGAHPFLLETEGDFATDPSERIELYERAKQLATDGGWVTYSIRIALARVLLEEMNEPGRALQELLACRNEIMTCADQSERQEWEELRMECARQTK